MADLATQLYDPLLRYHRKDGSDLTDKPAALKDAGLLAGEIAIRPNIKNLIDSLSTVKGDTTKLSDAIIEKWKTDKSGDFLKNLDADLGKNPKVAEQLIKAIQTNPNQIAAKVATYQPGNLAAMIPQAVVTPKVETPAPTPTTTTTTATPSTPAKQPKTVAPKAPAPVELVGPGEELITKPSPAAPANEDPKMTAEESREISAQIAKAAFAGLADKSDEEIAAAIDVNMVKGIARNMASEATKKYGVEDPAAKAFAQKIAGPEEQGGSTEGYDPQLAAAIAENLKRNPGFVRQLAKSVKDDAPPNKLTQTMAKPLMTSVMENPEKLAEDAYVKDLSQKMDRGSKLGGFGKILSSIFGEGIGGKIAGWFSAIFEQIKGFFSQFTGEKSVLSMRSGGNGSMLPTAMLNVDNMRYNREAAEAQANYSPRQMTALTTPDKDGKFFHNGEQLKDKDGKPTMKDGKPVYEQVPNGQITLKTADGKDFKGIPSVGALSAIELQNGNVRVPIVETIDAKGAATKVTQITMTREAFEEYKKIADAKGQERGGSIKSLTLETLEERTVQRAPLTVKMASVDPSSGATTPLTTIDATTGQPVQPGAQRPAVETFPVRSSNDPAANDRDFKLQG